MPIWLCKAIDRTARVFGRELVLTQEVIECKPFNGYRTYRPGPVSYRLDPIER